MILIGLTGNAGVGKDACADYLAEAYGFIKFSFSDALYDEVQQAYGLEDQSLLRDRATKEALSEKLSLMRCADDWFAGCVYETLKGRIPPNAPLSPRQVLQWYGTEYRRKQDPDYWVNRAADWMEAVQNSVPYPEMKPQLFVNTSVRFENERRMIHGVPGGNVWHIRRDNLAAVHQHESEAPLPVLEGERELWNNADLQRLYKGVDLLLSTSAKFVRVEPLAPASDHPGWCCEQAEAQDIPICPECASISAAYQEAMFPPKE